MWSLVLRIDRAYRYLARSTLDYFGCNGQRMTAMMRCRMDPIMRHAMPDRQATIGELGPMS